MDLLHYTLKNEPLVILSIQTYYLKIVGWNDGYSLHLVLDHDLEQYCLVIIYYTPTFILHKDNEDIQDYFVRKKVK